ncbi:MAG TPA: flagellar protein FlaG [Burkholderiaceae bacterium]
MDIKPLASGVQSGTATQTPLASNTRASAAVSNAAASATGAPPSASEPSSSQVAQALQKINATPVVQSQGIEFAIDSSSHRIVVKVVDQSNNQVIRQIPSKEALAIAESLDESPSGSTNPGLLIKQQA